MKRDLSLFIEDILENIRLIEKSIMNLTQEQFENDKDIIDATVRRMEIIGEAAKNIPSSFREKYQTIPWKKVVGVRNIIIHQYFRVDVNFLWAMIKNDLPPLKKNVMKMRNDLK